jgi:hypothetical protein
MCSPVIGHPKMGSIVYQNHVSYYKRLYTGESGIVTISNMESRERKKSY